MSDLEAGAFDAGVFFGQIRKGIEGLDIPERVEDARTEQRAWEAWHGYLARREKPTWHFDAGRFGRAMQTCWPGLAKVWVALSDQLIEGTFHQGAMRIPYVPGKGLDWNANSEGVPGWAGYLFFLRWPIRAAMLTGDERYVRTVAECLETCLARMDDIREERQVPVPGSDEMRSYTLWNTLALGLKLKALGEALYALRDHPAWTVADCRNTSILIWRHADFLYRQVSAQTAVAWQQQLNFISSGSGGLGAVGALLPEWTAATDWLETARQIQEVLLLNQVHPDGMQKEICTQYHKTVIRSFATLQMILYRQGMPSFYDTEPFRSRFLAMHRFLGDVLTPQGFTPAINSAVYAMDWVVFTAVGNTFFKDPTLQWHVNRWYHPDFVPVQKGGPGWGTTILNELCVPGPGGGRARAPRSGSRLFPDSGIAVLRDGWGEEANVLVLDFGHPDGGHAYAAQASFTAWVKGRPAVLSPGSPFSYTDPNYRPWYYGTQGQNTVWVDEDDQEIWRPGRKRRIWGRLLDWRDNAGETLVRISHNGYTQSKGIGHERTVLLKKGRFFLIYDLLDGGASEGAHTLRWTIRCPDALREATDRTVVSTGKPGIRLVPGWTGTVKAVEIGWGPSMVPLRYQPDMSPQQGQTCHARFVQRLAGGETARFLVLLVAGDCTDASVRGEVREGGVEVEVRAWGERERVVL